MKAPRITSARTIPINSTRDWYARGTANRLMISMKTKRLSTDRLFSTSQPA